MIKSHLCADLPNSEWSQIVCTRVRISLKDVAHFSEALYCYGFVRFCFYKLLNISFPGKKSHHNIKNHVDQDKCPRNQKNEMIWWSLSRVEF